MVEMAFEPKQGRIRDSAGRTSFTTARRVLTQAGRAGASIVRQRGHIAPDARRRGTAPGFVCARRRHGCLAAAGCSCTPATPGSRSATWARAHLHELRAMGRLPCPDGGSGQGPRSPCAGEEALAAEPLFQRLGPSGFDRCRKSPRSRRDAEKKETTGETVFGDCPPRTHFPRVRVRPRVPV